MREMLTPEASDTHWVAERRLAVTIIVIMLLLIDAAVFLPALGADAAVLGLPFGYFMAVLGVPVALVLLVGLFLARQAALDEAHDAAEE